MTSLVKKLIAPVVLATALLFSPVKTNANPSSEKINSPEYAEEVTTDKAGYQHWRFGDVWYSNAPLKEHSEDKIKFLSKTSTDYEDIRMNPFFQPNDTTLNYYGSGDLNNDNQRTQVDLDSVLAKYGPVDQADINGNEIPFETNDYNLLFEHITNNSLLPSDWNIVGKTDNYPEKLKSWFDKTMAIDKTDKIPYTNDWQCGNFSKQTIINFHGFGEIAKNSSLISEIDPSGKYDFSNNGRFNIPVFYVTISSDEKGLSHAIIGGETNYQGQGPLDFSNWSFKEPQDDSDVSPGDFSMPNDSRVRVYHSFFFYHESTNKFYFGQEPFIEFQLTNGNPELVEYDERLILQRPVKIKPEKPSLLEKFVLNQNYPNPFNSQTEIKYSIPLEDKVKLQVYDIQGKLVKTLVNEKKKAGEYSVDLNSSNLSSGIYLYNLQTSKGSQTKKMSVLK